MTFMRRSVSKYKCKNVCNEDYSRLISNLMKMIRRFHNTNHEGLDVERKIDSHIIKGSWNVFIIEP